MIRSICRKIGKVRFFWGLTRYRAALDVPLPTHIEIEPTTRCNATCGTCSRNYLAPESMKNDMSPESLVRILDQFPGLRSIRLVGLGEPFLHPRMADILALLKARGLKVWLITNGSLLRNPAVRQMIHACVHEVGISIDSTDPAEFARLRPMGEVGLAEVLEGTRALLRERQAGQSNVIIGINNTVTQQNCENLHAIGSLCIDLGVDYLAISFVENWLAAGDPGHAESAARVREAMTHLERIVRHIRRAQWRLAWHGIIVGYKIPRRRIGACHWPYRSAHITAEGHVTPCCTRTQPQHRMFNILGEDGFARHWNGPQYHALRQAHLDKDTLNPVCGNCPL